MRRKKWAAVFEEPASGRTKTVHFGASGYDDFTSCRDERRKRLYLQRHGRGRERWDDPLAAGALSRWLLWNLPTLEESLADFRRRFGV